jgi:hypothetical protein
VTENDSRLPIVAFMAGRFMDEMPGMSLRPRRHDRRGQGGHGDREDRPPREAGHHVAERIEDIPGWSRSEIGVTSLFIDVEVARGRARPGAGGQLTRSARRHLRRGRRHARDRRGEPRRVRALCRLCIDAAPPGTVAVRKLYDGGSALCTD